MRLRHWLPVVLALSTVSLASTARADTPPDIVRMKDGGMLRGTIVEMSPTGNVVITLPTGEQRTIPMSEVQYAGPAAVSQPPPAQPAPAQPPPTQPPAAVPPTTTPPPAGPAANPWSREGRARPKAQPATESKPLVSVRSTEAQLQLVGDGLTFYRKSGTASGWVSTGQGGGRVSSTSYQLLCTAPCEVSMPAGTYTMAVSKDGDPAEADPITIRGNATLEGQYKSQAGVRIAGLVLIIAGVSAAVVPVTVTDNKTASVAGLTLGLATVLVGGILIQTRDTAEIRVIPGAPTALHPRGDLRADRGSSWLGMEPGLSLAATF